MRRLRNRNTLVPLLVSTVRETMTSAAQTAARIVLVCSCLMGLVLFGAGFAATHVARPQIEQAAQDLLRAEVERRARAHLGDRADRVLEVAGHARALAARLGEHSEALEALSESSWPDVVGWLLAQRCDIDCEEVKAAKAQEKASGIRAPIVQAVDALPDAPVPPC